MSSLTVTPRIWCSGSWNTKAMRLRADARQSLKRDPVHEDFASLGTLKTQDMPGQHGFSASIRPGQDREARGLQG
jgi:hypothetical protein